MIIFVDCSKLRKERLCTVISATERLAMESDVLTKDLGKCQVDDRDINDRKERSQNLLVEKKRKLEELVIKFDAEKDDSNIDAENLTTAVKSEATEMKLKQDELLKLVNEKESHAAAAEERTPPSW